MIVVRLMGGLGNQMFQYALGRRLACEQKVPLKLDLSWFEANKTTAIEMPRDFALDGWQIEAAIATSEDLAQFQMKRSVETRLRCFFSFITKKSSKILFERGFAFDEGVLRARAPVFLEGYWQSEKYFRSIETILRNDFSLSTPLCVHSIPLLERIGQCTAVSVHVRRGDYISNSSTNAYHGACSIEYYRKAAGLIAERVASPHFFVFSDEPGWAKKNLTFSWPVTYVEHEESCSDHQDIWIMSRCSHHIIANSSFSWWGAWLSSFKKKVVVAPRRWFRKSSIDTSDLIPPEWLRV